MTSSQPETIGCLIQLRLYANWRPVKSQQQLPTLLVVLLTFDIAVLFQKFVYNFDANYFGPNGNSH